MYVFSLQRFAFGFELLSLHGMPVSKRVSKAMGSVQLRVQDLRHRAQCKLAGNSMHAACVGLLFLAFLSFKQSSV